MADQDRSRTKSFARFMAGVLTVLVVSGSLGGGAAWLIANGKIPFLKLVTSSDADGSSAKQPARTPLSIRVVPTILTNLVGDNRLGIRLDLRLVFEASTAIDDAVVAQFSQDVLVYLRTLKPSQVLSNTGVQVMMEDIHDIARVRSQGSIKNVLIASLILE